MMAGFEKTPGWIRVTFLVFLGVCLLLWVIGGRLCQKLAELVLRQILLNILDFTHSTDY